MNINEIINSRFIGVELDKEPIGTTIQFTQAYRFTFAFINNTPTGKKQGSSKIFVHSFICAN